jgi:hypothetical protein
MVQLKACCSCKYFLFLSRSNTESPIKSTDIDFSLYTQKTLTPDFKIHWRILKEQKEIEMVLVVNGTSWVGFGWRPKKLTAECRKFPMLHDEGGETSAEPASEPTSEPSSEPEPKGEPTTVSEPSSEPEPSKEPASEPSSEPAAEVVAEPESTSEPKSEPSSEPKSEPAKKGKSLEPLALGSSKSKRVAAPQTQQTPKIAESKDEYTVSTSVSYRVSAVTGRRKREAQKGKTTLFSIKNTWHKQTPIDVRWENVAQFPNPTLHKIKHKHTQT